MKKTIGWKIIFTYMIILIISFAVMGILFNSLVRTFLVREVQSNLQKEGKVLAILYDKVSLESIQKDKTEKRPTFILANSFFEGDNFIVDLNKKVVFSSKPKIVELDSNIKIPLVEKALQGNETKQVLALKNKSYVMVSMPLRNQKGNIKGAMVVFTELKGVQKFGTSIIQLLLKVLLAVSIFTIILGVFLARSISKPIKQLEQGARRLGAKDFDTRIQVHTGDELEQLSNTFNTMARELKQYYLAQKKFLQNASHELKTPLMSIQGYAEGIKDGVLSGEEKEKGLEIIIAESKRLKSLVNELIYLSKLETMEEVYSYARQDINEILKESCAKVKNMAQQKNVQIIYNEPANSVLADVDGEKITQAFINLLSNGIRFAKSKVDIALKLDGDLVHIEFNDDGEGFADDELNSVFDRFYRGQKGDTGLGLAITKAIVEKHGGKIMARNNHAGASIILFIPLSALR